MNPENGPSPEEMGLPLNQFETNQENITTPGEIEGLFRELAKNGYRELRMLADEKGVYLWEIMAMGDSPGEEIEYGYKRERNAQGRVFAHEIHATFYQDGEMIYGTSVARFVDGKWKML